MNVDELSTAEELRIMLEWTSEQNEHYSMIDQGSFYWQIENSRFIQLYKA